MGTRLRVLAAAALLLSGAACSTTKLTGVWRDPDDTAQPVGRIFVIGVMMRDQTFDAGFERALANAFRDRGFEVMAASDVFSPWDLDRDAVEKWVRDHRVDLVVQQRLTTHTTSSYTPPSSALVPGPYNPPGGWYGGPYGGYPAGYVSTRPGYVSEETSVASEIKAFRFPGGRLVWSASASTANVVGDQDAARSLAAEVASDLVRAGILVK